MAGFIYYLAAMGAILCGSALLPSLIAFGGGENELGFRILLYASLGGFLCIATLLGISGRPVEIERRSAAFLVVTSWILFPVLVAIPLTDITGLTYIQALFQTTSSFTTTGSVVFGNLESVPRSIVFLLAQMQWLGGLATLITFILVLSPWGIGGLPKASSASDAASVITSEYRLVKFCGGLFRGMLGLTILCFVLLLMAGVPAYEGIILSFSALSTGGIVPIDNGLDLLLGNTGMIIFAIFLIVGATSIFWHRNIVNLNVSDLVAHRESYFLAGVWAVLSLYLAYLIVDASGSAGDWFGVSAISEGMMNAASIISTSGIQSRNGIFTLMVPTLVTFLVIMGAGCFSTGGGVKLFRIGAIFSHYQDELNRLIYPSSVGAGKFTHSAKGLEFMKGIWAFFSLWVIALGIMTFIMAVSGMDYQAGFTSVVAALSNAGPVYGSYWETTNTLGWPEYADMHNGQLIVLTIAMLLGRLEIVVLFASIGMLFRNAK